MTASLGVSVTRNWVHAVRVERGEIRWAAHAAYGDPQGLIDAIGNLASECDRRPRCIRVVLGRDLVQFRTLVPAPPLKAREVDSFVSLHANRLFRRSGTPLIVDALLARAGSGERALFAAAVPETMPKTVMEGCSNAGISLETIGTATEVLPWTVRRRPTDNELEFPCGVEFEVVSIARSGVWRSRRVKENTRPSPEWVDPLTKLGDKAAEYSAAFGAATRRPGLELAPQSHRAGRLRERRARLLRLALVVVGVWLVPAVVYPARLLRTAAAAERELVALSGPADSVLLLRRDLSAARTALATMTDAERSRSRSLELLADLSTVLDDSTFLASIRVQGDSIVRLAGYSRSAARARANLERARTLQRPEFETPVTRQALAGSPEDGPWDRFAVVGRRRPRP